MKIIAVILFLIAGIGFLEASSPKPKCRQFEFTYETVVKDLPKDAKEVKIWIPYPQDSACQNVWDIQVVGISDYHIYKSGRNRMLFIDIKKPKAENINFSLRFNVKRNEELHKIIFSKTAPEAHEIYDYVYKNMSYDKTEPGWGTGDVERACRVRKGNCTDFHSLFIALAEKEGIPTKFVMGIKLPNGKEGEVRGYHCWAEFYAKGTGWLPVDISEAWKDKAKRDYYFGNLCEDRVQLSEGRNIVLSPRQHGAPLNYFIYPYVEIDGAPYDKVEKNFKFKNI